MRNTASPFASANGEVDCFIYDYFLLKILFRYVSK
jgi:hypothetical protein